MIQDGAPSEAANSGATGFGFHLDPRIDGLDPPWTKDGFSSPDVADACCHAWDILKVIFARFWAPVQLFALSAVQQWRLYERLDWLRPVELMLRRIIFIEAQARAADLPDPGPLRPKRPHKPCPWPDLSFDTANATAWRVSFANLRPAQPGRPRRPYTPTPERAAWEALLLKPREHGRMLNPRPLAYRLEAIIRLCIDPWPRIARLAARMKRGLVPLLAPRARGPRPVRTPRTLPTLNRLGALMGLDTLKRRDSS